VKAVILAAGFGERMRPLTEKIAKPVLPVLNEPLIVRTLRAIRKAGIRDVAINIHYRPETIRAAIPTDPFGLKVRFSREARILGTGGALRKLRAWIGREPVLVVNGDVVFDFDLARLVKVHHEAQSLATLILRENPDPDLYKPVLVDGRHRIVAMRGKPAGRTGRALMFASVHVIEPVALARLPAGPSDLVEHLYIPLLREGSHLQGVREKGAWFDLGNPATYLASQVRLLADSGRRRAALLDASVRIGRGTRVTRSVAGPGCVIGENARVEGSVLWDDVFVAPGTTVRGCVVMSGARLGAGPGRSRRSYVGRVVGPRADLPLPGSAGRRARSPRGRGR
jgi:NDP-sugar pyrophosphorylase family protein